MVQQDSEDGWLSRRQLLRLTGGSAALTALAGCGETPNTTGTNTRPSVTSTEGTVPGTGTDTPTETQGEKQVAKVYGIDTDRLEGASSQVEALYADYDYRRVIETGGEGWSGARRVSHMLGYGHDLRAPEAAPPDRPTLHSLSAGALSTPATAAADSVTGRFVDAPLSEAVRAPENNLLLSTMGLSSRVEWLQQPLPYIQEMGSIEALGTRAEVRSFIGSLRATAGTGLAPREEVGYLVTLIVARMTVGDDAVLFGMVDAWDRPPSATPKPGELDESTRDLLSRVKGKVNRARLFRRSVGGYLRGLSALPGPDERPPPPKTKRTTVSYNKTPGLDRTDRIELGYPAENTTVDNVFESFVKGRNVPSLLSGKSYDPAKHSRGTEYLVTAEVRTASYPLGGDETIPFGVIASPRVQLQGKERNPLATTKLSKIGGNAKVWDLLRRTRGSTAINWQGTRTTFTPSVSPLLLGNTTILSGVSGKMSQASSGTVSTSDVDVYLARTLTPSEVVIALAVNANTGTGYWARRTTAAGLFKQAVERVRFNPTNLNQWVDASLDTLKLVQIVSDTRLERAGGDAHGQPDPPLAIGRNTAPRVDFSTFSGTAFDGLNPAYGVLSFDVSGPSVSSPWTVIDQSDLKAVDENQKDSDRVFHDAVGDGDPDTNLPVFELDGNHSGVTASVQAPSGYQYDSATVQKGNDFSTTSEETLRVGVTSVVDPDNGSNYGNAAGRVSTYQDTVDACFEYLRRTFPTGIALYRDDTFIAGNVAENQDYKDARVALERTADPNNNTWTYSGATRAHGLSQSAARSGIRNNGFDVWLLVVPNGYYNYHKSNSRPTGLAPFNDLFAVTTVEAARQGAAGAAETAAQEIGHRLGDDQYADPRRGGGEDYPLAQRDPDGSDYQNRIDYDHARRVDNSPAGPDPPGLVSRAYSLVTGEFQAFGGHRYDTNNDRYILQGPPEGPRRSGSRISYGAQNLSKRTGRVESYMSYSGWDLWADSIITRIIANGDLNRDARTFRTATVLGNLWYESADSAGNDSDEPVFEMRELDMLTDWIYRPNEEELASESAPTTITLHDPAGEQVAKTRATTGAKIDGDGVEDTELDHVITFGMELPETAAELRAERDGLTLQVNPITRAIKEAVESLPDAAFAAEPAAARDRVEQLVTRMNEAMAVGEYGQARNRLQEYREGQLPEDFDSEYDPLGNEIAFERLQALVERLLERLTRLAEFEA